MLDKSDVRQSFFGQKINLSPCNLCCINMFLRNTSFEKFGIALGCADQSDALDDEPQTYAGKVYIKKKNPLFPVG